VYLLVYNGSQAAGSGALRPIDDSAVEIRCQRPD
jgi:hypothetical protein